MKLDVKNMEWDEIDELLQVIYRLLKFLIIKYFSFYLFLSDF